MMTTGYATPLGAVAQVTQCHDRGQLTSYTPCRDDTVVSPRWCRDTITGAIRTASRQSRSHVSSHQDSEPPSRLAHGAMVARYCEPQSSVVARLPRQQQKRGER